MAKLLSKDENGNLQHFSLFKRLTSIGSSANADIVFKHMPSICAYISQTGDSYTLIIPAEQEPAYFNNRAIKKHELNDEDTFLLSGLSITFKINEEDEHKTSNEAIKEPMIAYQRLLDFSQKVASEKNIETLLKTLLKEITQITGAEHGFLVLIEDGQPEIKVQQSSTQDEEHKEMGTISDSIVKKVIKTKEPVIINDALNDQEFCSSKSVINYQLTSIMCTPLIYQGELFGVIYVGNNSFINAFDKKSLDIMTIYSSQAALLVQNALHINALKKRTKTLQESLEFTKFGGIIGSCYGMQAVFQQVEKVAEADISILIVGETGTGKELIARELHNRSLRSKGPFIVINCGAIPENLLESELFGHVRGAFTGAVQSRIGKFQAAHNGTIFLDEIGEMPLHLQVKLLRTLQDHRVTRVGDNKSEEVNIRVIAATNKNLLDLVKENLFREDLYYRLNVVQITVPPLKERGHDILVIANFFLQKYAKIYGKQITGMDEEAKNTLLNYDWPGNVRQLENRMRRAIVMCDNNKISISDLDIHAETSTKVVSLTDALDRFRERYINESLARNDGNRTKTALELGVDPRTIFRHLENKKKPSDLPNH